MPITLGYIFLFIERKLKFFPLIFKISKNRSTSSDFIHHMKKSTILIGCLLSTTCLTKADTPINLFLLSRHNVKVSALQEFAYKSPEIFKHAQTFLNSLPQNTYIISDFIKLWASLENAWRQNLSLENYCTQHHLKFSSEWETFTTKMLLNAHPKTSTDMFEEFEDASEIWTQPLQAPRLSLCGTTFAYLPSNYYLNESYGQRCLWELLDCIYCSLKFGLNIKCVFDIFNLRVEKINDLNYTDYEIHLLALHKNASKPINRL